MAKIKLTASPTFKAKVSIPIPGGRPADVEFIFKGRTRDEFKSFIENIRDRQDLDVIMDCVSGWELDDPFGPDTMAQLLNQYIGATSAIIDTYIKELTAARQGN